MACYLLTETTTITFECEATSRIDALNKLLYAKQGDGDGDGIGCSGVDVEWHESPDQAYWAVVHRQRTTEGNLLRTRLWVKAPNLQAVEARYPGQTIEPLGFVPEPSMVNVTIEA